MRTWVGLGAGVVFVLFVFIVLPGPMESFWFNIPGRHKRAEIRALLEEAAQTPSGRDAVYAKIVEKAPGGASSAYALVPFVFDVMEDDPKLRVAGLGLVRTCGASSREKYAPRLSVLVDWLDDPDPEVVEATLTVLSGFTWRRDCRSTEFGKLSPEGQASVRDGWKAWYKEGDYTWTEYGYAKKSEKRPDPSVATYHEPCAGVTRPK